MSLAASVLAGERLALSRLLTLVENDTAEGRGALAELFPYTGRAHLIGVTGAPGTGKSSLVNGLARHLRQSAGEQAPPRVAIIAVDPTSPFTGGAILGDRVRMRELSGDSGVFIRSMASRGSLGGLATATSNVVQAFDAAGFDVILIETVGAGQAEVDIARLAHTTLVIEAPGLGDDIQAIKAGILEIADVLVVNKADQPGADNTERALRNMLELAHPVPRVFRHHARGEEVGPPVQTAASSDPIWIPPVQRTVALDGKGIPELVEAISRHRQFLQQSGDWQRREQARLETELENSLREALMARWQASVSDRTYQDTLAAVFQRQLSPHQAVKILLNGGHP